MPDTVFALAVCEALVTILMTILMTTCATMMDMQIIVMMKMNRDAKIATSQKASASATESTNKS